MKILLLFGTRPEAIKMAPVVKTLAADSFFQPKVCVTGQHRKMLDQVLQLFEIEPDFDLDIMKPDQDLFDITSAVLLGLRQIFHSFRPDMVLVHGDTTTCFAGSLASFYSQIPVGHIEAGLRTGDLMAPYPEEANRLLTSRLAALHFSPTTRSGENLVGEGIPEESVIITGNTVVDALLLTREKVAGNQDWSFSCYGSARQVVEQEDPFVLVTGHRRENFGRGFHNICSAIDQLAGEYPGVHFIYPVHLNPNVHGPVYQLLDHLPNIHLIPPIDYAPFVYLMDRCSFILTDSGGIQEEAPSLQKPVLVMRETTERPEALEAGTIILVGTDQQKIVTESRLLLDGDRFLSLDSNRHNPYGDGRAAERIKIALKSWYNKYR